MSDRHILARLSTLERTVERLRKVDRAGASATYTPTYAGGSTAGVTTYAADGQVGRYTRIGNVCVFSARVEWSNATGTGEARLSLPFTSMNVANLNQVVAVQPNNVTYSQDYLVAQILPNTSYARFVSPISNAAAAVVDVEAAGILVVSGSYLIEV